ncbi:hypothetical protein HRD57_03840 [Tetragenococcus halophilus]|nr:hypothetical protein [Tetragenococcus halophilus]
MKVFQIASDNHFKQEKKILVATIIDNYWATFLMWHQSVNYWGQLFRCPTNLKNIGGNFSDVPPI